IEVGVGRRGELAGTVPVGGIVRVVEVVVEVVGLLILEVQAVPHVVVGPSCDVIRAVRTGGVRGDAATTWSGIAVEGGWCCTDTRARRGLSRGRASALRRAAVRGTAR